MIVEERHCGLAVPLSLTGFHVTIRLLVNGQIELIMTVSV